jgi:hypothetical protein
MVKVESPKARSLLQSVYDRFSEGFETADLKTAKAYLNSWQYARGGGRAGAVIDAMGVHQRASASVWRPNANSAEVRVCANRSSRHYVRMSEHGDKPDLQSSFGGQLSQEMIPATPLFILLFAFRFNRSNSQHNRLIRRKRGYQNGVSSKAN